LTGAVQSNDSNFCAVEVRQINILEDRLLVVELADADHRVNDFVWFGGHKLLGLWPLVFGFSCSATTEIKGQKSKAKGQRVLDLWDLFIAPAIPPHAFSHWL